MGNCMETYSIRQQDAMEMQQQQQQQEEETRAPSGLIVKRNGDEGQNGLRMKVVLTKEELKWLILQLNEKGGMRLEQVLEEIKRGREKIEGTWKPSLESIVEAPEMLEN